jgi:hypothetical protein
MKRKRQRRRRWSKVPDALWQEFRRLLLETDLPAAKCAKRVGILPGGSLKALAIVKDCRRYIGPGQWVNRKTGKLCPEICTTLCAAEKTGLSRKTVWRRATEQGFVPERRATSNAHMLVFTDEDIKTIKALGKYPKDRCSVLSREDVEAIRELAAHGHIASEIAERYPVSVRQINRIIRGDRWKKKEGAA